MSVIGKGSSSFKKQDVMEQKGIALGFKKIRFAHKATAGDTSINLTTLVTPTEMSSLGFTNPSPTTLVNAQLGIYRNNLKLVSSLRGLLVDQLSYVASSTAITFVGFTAEDGEIFQGWLDEAPTTSLQVVDGTTIVASGILAAGQTDFNIGTPITINKNPAQTIGAVMVFADRGLQYRKAGNVTTGDGDYIEVPVAGGLGSLIRFNASGSDRFITVMSNGVVSERPDGSMMAAIERVQGQVDAMVPTLAQVAGVPTTTFQIAPNDVNLKQFGDQVVTNTTTIADHETRIDNLETPSSLVGSSLSQGPFGSSIWSNLPGASITLSPGTWTVLTDYVYTNNGASPIYTDFNAGLFVAPGTGTGTPPTGVSVLTPGVTFLSTSGAGGSSGSALCDIELRGLPGSNRFRTSSNTVITVSTNLTVYASMWATSTTPANARFSVSVYARKIGN